MNLEIALSMAAVFIVTALIGKFVKLSPKYDRKPRERTAWQRLDHGDDPTEDR